jgi:hypothetical protein
MTNCYPRISHMRLPPPYHDATPLHNTSPLITQRLKKRSKESAMLAHWYTHNPELDEYDEQELDDAFDNLLDGTTDEESE